jgi:hypothetical protein
MPKGIVNLRFNQEDENDTGKEKEKKTVNGAICFLFELRFVAKFGDFGELARLNTI